MQIKPIKTPQHLPPRQRKLQDQHMPARPQHATNLPEPSLPVRQIPQAKRHRDHIETFVCKRKLARVLHRDLAQTFFLGHRQHLLGEIGADHSSVAQPPLQHQSQIPCARRQIEHLARLPRLHNVGRAFPPVKIAPATQGMIRQIVPPGDRSKHAPDTLRLRSHNRILQPPTVRQLNPFVTQRVLLCSRPALSGRP